MSDRTEPRFAAAAVLALALALRLLQLSYAMVSPLTYQLGPDEDYYLRFGQAVAAWQGQNSSEFTFMDPAYGFLLGGIVRLFGPNLFIVYLLQAVLDALTAYGVLLIGRRLQRPRAGLFAGVLYALTSTAILFSSTLLKEVWVSAFVTWWVAVALTLLPGQRRWAWLLFGCYGGLGIAFRSTLLPLALLAVLLPLLAVLLPLLARIDLRARVSCSALALCGLLIALLPWSLRNERALGSFSPLPSNGGIVLHQIYNDQNPDAGLRVPDFVSYSHPSEIWRGYAAEAERRQGTSLSARQIDHFWRGEALAFIAAHPGEVLRDVLRKNLEWFASTEVASNRSDAQEKMFSPLLRYLPAPGIWLMAAGLAGILWLALEDRRWLIVAVPVLLAWLTMTVFLAESRFRFHAASMLALGAGVLIDQVIAHARERPYWRVPAFVGLAGMIGAVSIALGERYPAPPVQWDRITWGYIRMGRLADAQSVAEQALRAQPDDGAVREALGFLAASRGDYAGAVVQLQRAVTLRPRSHIAHYNLARAYLALGDDDNAASEARRAFELNPLPEYQALLNQIAAR